MYHIAYTWTTPHSYGSFDLVALQTMVDMPPETLVWHSQLSRVASEQCTNHNRVRGKINAGSKAAAH
jgi:hypothetical protein